MTYSETFYVLGVAMLLCIPIGAGAAKLGRQERPGRRRSTEAGRWLHGVRWPDDIRRTRPSRVLGADRRARRLASPPVPSARTFAAPRRRRRSPLGRPRSTALRRTPRPQSRRPLPGGARSAIRSSRRSSRRRWPTARTSPPRRRVCASLAPRSRSRRANALPKSGASASYINAELPKSTVNIGDSNLYNLGFDATWEVDLFGGTRRAVQAASAESVAVAGRSRGYARTARGGGGAGLCRSARPASASGPRAPHGRARGRGARPDRAAPCAGSRLGSRRGADPHPGREHAREHHSARRADQPNPWTSWRCSPAASRARSMPSSAPARPLPTLPATVAVGDPAAMLRRRPDIRAAEFRLASQTAQIGEREADWFPKLTLFGDLGFSAATPGSLVRSDNFLALGIPYLQWNALDFGRTRARVNQARAGRDEAEAKYRSTVLGALRDADGALSRYGHQRKYVVKLAGRRNLGDQGLLAHGDALPGRNLFRARLARRGAHALLGRAGPRGGRGGADQGLRGACRRALGLGWQS